VAHSAGPVFLLLALLVVTVAPVDISTAQAESALQPEPSLLMDGYCPVSLRTQNNWVRGDAKFQVCYEGVRYWCASQRAVEMFRANPEKFYAIRAGIDVVVLKKSGRKEAGSRMYGAIYGNRYYMFVSQQSRFEFCKDPARYRVER